jgi:hypothetical protein
MRAFTTIFLTHTLSTILEHIEQTSNLDLELPELLDFKTTLLNRIEQLRNEELPGLSGPYAQAA